MMSSRQVYTEVDRIAQARGLDDVHRNLLLELVLERESVRSSILAKIRMVRHDLNHVELMLARPDPLLNTLGELQGHPAQVEAAVGQFAAASRALKSFLDTFPEKPDRPERE
jgi:hypothetical protein